MFYVYVLKSLVNQGYYIGHTDNIKLRLNQHNHGYVRSTCKYRPWTLLGFEIYEKRNEARWREHELKNHGTKRNGLIKTLEENIKQIA